MKSIFKYILNNNYSTIVNNIKYIKIIKSNFSSKIFTVSLIGRPNVGKSTLFNKLVGTSASLVDSLPGLTRDRKEYETDYFGMKIKFVDTAGIDTFESDKINQIIEKEKNKNNKLKSNLNINLKNKHNTFLSVHDPITNENIIKKSIEQTKNALLYSDLALFIIDGRLGITNEDKELANWLINTKNNFNELEKLHNLAKSLNENKDEEEFFNKIKELKNKESIKLPEIILVANKIDDDFYPEDLFNNCNLKNFNYPLLISAEHGDGIPDLLKEINDRIPEEKKEEFIDRGKLRIKRYEEYKQVLKNQFIKDIEELNNNKKTSDNNNDNKTSIKEKKVLSKNDEEKLKHINYSIESWEKDYDYFNGQDIENNSDYDSDNDIDPIDNFIIRSNVLKNKHEKYSIESETNFKTYKKTIKVSVIGQPNVGKSSIINKLIKENRLIVSDIPGTTRDVIPVNYIYKGKRIEISDTAGIKNICSNTINPNIKKTSFKLNKKIDKLISEKTINSIKNSHVIVYIIDSMKAFTPYDLKLINFIGEEGKSVVILCNKWDLVGNGYKMKAKKWIDDQIEKHCTEYKNPKLIFTSAKTNYRVETIMEEVVKTYKQWNTRISTKLLNSFNYQLGKIAKVPNIEGEYLNLKFITQVKVRPPSFVLFLNDIDLFFKSHENYLKKLYSKEFGFSNTPLRFIIRDRNVKSNTELSNVIKKSNKMNIKKEVKEDTEEVKNSNYDNPFKKVTPSTARIERKISILKSKVNNITYMRRSKGKELLYGRHKPRSIRNYKRY